MSEDTSGRILVPVDDSPTLRNTVAYAIREASERAADGETPTVHFVHAAVWRLVSPVDEERRDEAMELLDRIGVWAEEDLSEDLVGAVTIETALVGFDRYLFSPRDFANVVIEYAEDHDLDRVVVDPEYQPGGNAPMLRPFEFELSQSGLTVEEAPVERETRRNVFVRRGGTRKTALVFGVSYLFYLLIGGFGGVTDAVTGAISAAIVAWVLGPIVVKHRPDGRRLARQSARMLVYAPWLLWEIAKANVQIAYYVLHPSLPIDPRMERVEAAVWGDLPATTLANSITLTPGTLTVDVEQREFLVHTLVEPARHGLLEGGLERAVRFVFYGRPSSRIPGPSERRALTEEATEDASTEGSD